MTSPFSEFVWQVAKGGYGVAVVPRDSVGHNYMGGTCTRAEWSAPATEPRSIVVVVERPDPGRAEVALERLLIPKTAEAPITYRPWAEQPGLFRRFIELEESEAAVVKFASRFGPLYRPHSHVIPPWHPHGVETVPTEEHENPVDTWDVLVAGTGLNWSYQIRRLRAVVKLDDGIRSQDSAFLETLAPDTDVGLNLSGEWMRFPSSSKRVERGPQSPLDMAMALRDREIDKALVARPSQEPVVRARMVQGQLRLVAVHLLGLMWLQLATAIGEGKRFKRCPARNCPLVWFEVSTGLLGVREDAEFCSARCRHTAYRDRKNRARQMHRDGVPVPEIAKRMETAPGQIRTWIRKTKR